MNDRKTISLARALAQAVLHGDILTDAPERASAVAEAHDSARELLATLDAQDAPDAQ